MIWLNELDEIFCKDCNEYYNILLSGENKYYEIKVFGYAKPTMKLIIDTIKENIKEIYLVKYVKHNENYDKVLFNSKKYGGKILEYKGKILINKNYGDYCKEITYNEYLKGLI